MKNQDGGILDLGSELYPSNMQRMLNKDFTRFMQSLSRVRTPKWNKQKKALGCYFQIIKSGVPVN